MRLTTRLKVALAQRLLGGVWEAMRTQISGAVVPGGGGIVFLGDSLTHFGKWDLLFPGQPIMNFGIGGEMSSHLIERLNPVITQRPDRLFLLIGSNDIARGFEPVEVSRRIAALLGRVTQALPLCRIVLQSVMPRQRKYAQNIRALNQHLQDLAQARGLAFIDLYPLMDDGSGKMRADFTYDDIHLNGAGYQAWCRLLRPHLAAPGARGNASGT